MKSIIRLSKYKNCMHRSNCNSRTLHNVISVISRNSPATATAAAAHPLASYRRGYHSFPDANDKPIVSSMISEHKKTIIDKTTSEYTLDSKFKVDAIFPGVPTSLGIKKTDTAPRTIATKLSNGLTVATQDLPGSLMTSISFMINVGSANETQTEGASDVGSTHLLELVAFKSTKNRQHQQLIEEIEKLGGMMQCISSRESIMYCVDVFRENVDKALVLFADSILNPCISEEEVNECKEMITIQENEWPADLLSKDAVQMAAYKSYPLGNTHFCPVTRVKDINATMIQNYRKKYFTSENCIIAAAGIDHEHFVQLVQTNFASIPSIGKDAADAIKQKGKSMYVGGMIKSERELKEPFVKVAIAYETGGWKDELLVPACVLQMLLGGGSSFSAGGPGKGMYTRLYREVLNQYHWVESAESFLQIHDEAGIIGIDGSCQPEHVSHLIHVILQQLLRLEIELVSDEELDRAKNMLKSMMMMQLESRLVLCEDIARQYATFGFREAPASICNKIESVTKEDVQKVAVRMLQSGSNPSISCVGHDLSQVPAYDAIKSFSEKLRQEMFTAFNSTHKQK